MCSGRLDPLFVLKALASGADAVVMTGCWPADCHYRVQNTKALRRFELLSRVLSALGLEEQRFQRVYASAAEGQQLADAFTRIVEEVRALGPLDWGRRLGLATLAESAAPAEVTERSSAGRGPRGDAGVSERAKHRFAMYWASACGGCDVAVLNLHDAILDFAERFEPVFWPAVMDTKYADLAQCPTFRST